MGVNLCAGQRGMAEELLDDPDVGGSHESGGKSVSEHVGTDFAAEYSVASRADNVFYLTDGEAVMGIADIKCVVFGDAGIGEAPRLSVGGDCCFEPEGQGDSAFSFCLCDMCWQDQSIDGVTSEPDYGLGEAYYLADTEPCVEHEQGHSDITVCQHFAIGGVVVRAEPGD